MNQLHYTTTEGRLYQRRIPKICPWNPSSIKMLPINLYSMVEGTLSYCVHFSMGRGSSHQPGQDFWSTWQFLSLYRTEFLDLDL